MKSQSTSADVEAVVENCLPRLCVLWKAIDTYGCPQNAAVLRKVIDELQEAIPPGAISRGAMEFVANGPFRVPRSQVAQLLSIILRADWGLTRRLSGDLPPAETLRNRSHRAFSERAG